jgi:hypothetical protein
LTHRRLLLLLLQKVTQHQQQLSQEKTIHPARLAALRQQLVP